MRLLKLLLLLVVCAAGPAAAGPFEDARRCSTTKVTTRQRCVCGVRLPTRAMPPPSSASATCTSRQGVPQDYAAAASWYRKAADQGHADAQTNLGLMYDTGQGVPQDYAAAVSWYRKAADQGNVSAQYNLGLMYINGQGVPQDYAAAVSWYRKAADQGDADAQYNLGVMYDQAGACRRTMRRRRRGIAKPPTRAMPPPRTTSASCTSTARACRRTMCKRICGSTLRRLTSQKEDRDKAVKNRDRVAAKMTPAQIAEAQKLAREWKPKPER